MVRATRPGMTAHMRAGTVPHWLSLVDAAADAALGCTLSEKSVAFIAAKKDPNLIAKFRSKIIELIDKSTVHRLGPLLSMAKSILVKLGHVGAT